MKKIFTTLLTTLALTYAYNANAQTVMVKYDFNNNVGDSSGNNNHGTNNNVTYTADIAGVPNSAAAFNGTNAYVTIPDIIGPSAGAPRFKVGMSLWFKTNGHQKPAGIAYAGAQTIGNTPVNFTPFLWIDSTGHLNGYFYVGSIYSLVSADTVNDDKWHHVVFYYYNLPPNRQWERIWMDGKEFDSILGASLGTPSYTNIYLGVSNARNIGGMPDAWIYFNGTIDAFRMFISPGGPILDSVMHCDDFALTAHPQDQSVLIGSSTSLHVSHTAFLDDTVYTYQWKKNGVAIAGATDSVLNIASFASTDTGSYVCEVTNDHNLTLISRPGRLSIQNVGINNAHTTDAVSIYPNPAQDFVTVNTTQVNATMMIYDFTGKLVAQQRLDSGENIVPVSHLSAGNYMYRIMSKEGEVYKGTLSIN